MASRSRRSGATTGCPSRGTATARWSAWRPWPSGRCGSTATTDSARRSSWRPGKGGDVRAICVDPRTDPRWQRLVDRRPSSAFQSPAWTRVLAETYELDVRAIVLLDECGQPRAGIPFCRISDVFGERIVSLPFSDYCGPVLGDADDWAGLAAGLLAERCLVSIRCRHGLPGADERFALVKQARWHGADLRPDLCSLWNGLHDSSRRPVQQAQRH